MYGIRFFQFCMLLLCVNMVRAQEKSYLVRAGKLFDSEQGAFKTGMVILVKGKMVTSVKPEKEITAEDRKNFPEVIDLSNYTVVPGLIDAHTHLLNKEIIYPDNNEPGLDMAKTLMLDGDAYRAIYGSARARAYLEHGITAVQDLGNSGKFADMALRRAINEGLVPGPRMRCSGPGLSTEGGQLPGLIYKHQELASDEYRIIKGTDDAVQAVRENITQGADVIKIYANNTPNNTMLSVEEITAIVKEAHRYSVRVTAHATSDRAAMNAVIGGVDGIEHGYQLFDSTLELMARKNVVLVPTYGDSVVVRHYAELSLSGNEKQQNNISQMVNGYVEREKENLAQAQKKHVTIVAGSDDYVDVKIPMAEFSIRNLIGYHDAGMRITDILVWATINAARHLRWENKIGVIRRGAFADFAAFDADLDTNINSLLHARFVMKDGIIYKNELTGKF